MIESLSLDNVISIVKIPKSTLILCHRNPDPDTLGSAFALKHILEYFGSFVSVACCDKPSSKFNFITKGSSLEYQPLAYDRIIAVDVASPAQLGELSILCDTVELTIDHHGMNTRFSPYYEELCASCAEIIFELYKKLDICLPTHFFECIYAGITGDTGGFRYSNVTKRTMEYGAEAMEHGIDHAEINRIIFESKTFGEIVAHKLTYEKMKLYCDGGLAIILFTNEMKEENGLSEEDLGDIVNCIRSIEGVLVAVSIKQSSKDGGKFFISSRANCEIDVSAVCAQMGGGGHIRASGATITADSCEEALELCSKLFGKAVLEYQNKA
ncbi:MAG: bifunctional oligoribonuclease/PAP phosphatase NrnA [Clostridia bacterium]|nr:bifunctional oligoribonuclease/PAP phosphatase NrnA [Clostridia bacterium]